MSCGGQSNQREIRRDGGRGNRGNGNRRPQGGNWDRTACDQYTEEALHSNNYTVSSAAVTRPAHELYHKWECCRCKEWNSYVNKELRQNVWVYTCRCGHENSNCGRCRAVQPFYAPPQEQ